MTALAEPVVVAGPDADPEPWFRCRCASYLTHGWPDPYRHRCPTRPTGEDGLCDHCRQPFGCCADPECPDRDGAKGIGCCLQPRYAVPLFVELTTPCQRPELTS